MKRRNRRTKLTSNPFVAFADLAIAMSFVFALCSIALSKALSDITRDSRQAKAEKGFKDLMKREFDGVQIAPANWAKSSYDKQRNIELTKDGLVGKFSTNGSYQRIELTKAFGFGQARPTSVSAYLALGEVVRQAMARGDIDYVFLHGIVEAGEAEEAKVGYEADLAKARTEAIFNIWKSNNLVAGEGEPLASPTSPDFMRINPKFIVTYGKDRLYRNSDRLNKARTPGRVDILLFYTDNNAYAAKHVQ